MALALQRPREDQPVISFRPIIDLTGDNEDKAEVAPQLVQLQAEIHAPQAISGMLWA